MAENLYKKFLCNKTYIYEAYKTCCKGKKNKKDVQEYIENWSINFNKIEKDMNNKNREALSKYFNFTITRPKERSIDALEFEGRIIQHVLCDNILKPYFEPRLINTNCACRENKGTDYAINLAENYVRQIYKHNTYESIYVLKMDIKKYFPSIDREILKKKLKIFPDKDIKELLYWIIDHCPEDNGLPIGNQTSQWFALYYLDSVDRIIKEKFKMKYYVRYMDDLIIIHNDKNKLLELWKYLDEYVKRELKLEFNGKTQLFPLKRGISFLGWKIRCKPSTGKVTKKIDNSKKHDRNMAIKTIKNAYKNGEITCYEYNIRMQCIIQHLSKGNTYTYRKNHGVYLIPSKKEKINKRMLNDIINDIIKEDNTNENRSN